MNSRARVQAALRFERPDRLPCHESPWEQTLAAWREQGLPAGASAADHFGFDLCFMYLDTSPRFEQKILKRESGTITYEDRFGYTIRKPEGVSSTMHFLNHRTVDRESWEEVKRRLVLSPGPAEPARIDDVSYFGHFDPYPSWEEALAKYQRLRATGRYLLLMFYGPWEATWRHRGMEGLLLDVALQPDWVREMAESYQDLVLATLSQCVARGLVPDGVLVADDLGATQGPLLSPASWRQIFQPCVQQLGAFLREEHIDFWLHSDGAVVPLIDSFLDCGVAVLHPLEVKAGLDALELRKRYGKRLAFIGGLDARKMGGPEGPLLAELRRLAPLAAVGGYILHSDHSCPPDVSFERYSWLLQTARDLFDEAVRTTS